MAILVPIQFFLCHIHNFIFEFHNVLQTDCCVFLFIYCFVDMAKETKLWRSRLRVTTERLKHEIIQNEGIDRLTFYQKGRRIVQRRTASVPPRINFRPTSPQPEPGPAIIVPQQPSNSRKIVQRRSSSAVRRPVPALINVRRNSAPPSRNLFHNHASKAAAREFDHRSNLELIEELDMPAFDFEKVSM